MKKSLLIPIIFLFFSFIKTNFVYGDRLLIGFKRTVYDVMDKRHGETGSGWDNYLEFCKKDGNSDNSNSLSKKYENECPNGITNKDNIYEPSLELEINLTEWFFSIFVIMQAPRLPSFFKSPNAKNFSFKPRYYDERKGVNKKFRKKNSE